jgi:hypothetical protein
VSRDFLKKFFPRRGLPQALSYFLKTHRVIADIFFLVGSALVSMRIQVQIQYFFQCRSGSRVFMTKNWKKYTAGNLFWYFFYQKLQLFIPRPPWRTSKLQENPRIRIHNTCHNTGNRLHEQQRCINIGGTLLTLLFIGIKKIQAKKNWMQVLYYLDYCDWYQHQRAHLMAVSLFLNMLILEGHEKLPPSLTLWSCLWNTRNKHKTCNNQMQ